MERAYGIWLSWNNQMEAFDLPVLPQDMSYGVGGDSAGMEVLGAGKINIIKERQLAEFTIESIFPARNYPFVTTTTLLTPRRYIELLVKWMESKMPIRFVYVGETIDINIAASIEAFEWKEAAGSPGDIQYLIKFKEYNFYSARRVLPKSSTTAEITKTTGKRGDTRVPPKTYTLVQGDTLWSVAQRHLGSGARWKEIQQLNKITDAQLKRLPVGKVLRLP